MKNYLISIRKPFDLSRQTVVTEWITKEEIEGIESTTNQKLDLNSAIFNIFTNPGNDTEIVISFKVKTEKILLYPN